MRNSFRPRTGCSKEGGRSKIEGSIYSREKLNREAAGGIRLSTKAMLSISKPLHPVEGYAAPSLYKDLNREALLR